MLSKTKDCRPKWNPEVTPQTKGKDDCPKCGGKGYYEAGRSCGGAGWLATCNCK